MPNVIKHSTNNFVTVSYAVREVTIEITHAEHALILAFSTEKVKMIKFIRGQYNLGLYDAKQVIDTVIASAENDAKERLQTTNEFTSVTDWSKVPKGSRVYVRDCDTEEWQPRRFLDKIGTAECSEYPFVCLSEEGGHSINWKYAKLQAEL